MSPYWLIPIALREYYDEPSKMEEYSLYTDSLP